MAEGTDGNMELSLATDGSEAVYDFYCEVCRDSGLYLEAVGYCVDCGDYLCNNCFIHHKRSRLTLNHNILDQEDMPKDTPLSHDKCNRYIASKCNIHSGRTIEYYCKDHDFLGCSTCITMTHRNCPNVDSILHLPENFEQSTEYKTFEETMKSISQRSTDIIQQSRDSVVSSENCCKQTLWAVRKHREEINKRLDEFENILMKQAETIASDNAKAAESLSDMAKTISINMEKISSKIKKFQHSRKICQLYIAMKECSNDIKRMTASLDEAKQKYNVRLYDFVPSSPLTEMVKKVNSFGTIHTRQSVVKVDAMNTTAIHLSDIELKSDGKSSAFNSTGSAVLSRNKLICVDFDNNMIRLIDTQSYRLVCELKSEYNTWDVCTISGNQAAITTDCNKTILFVKAKGTIEVEGVVRVNGTCRGIAYSRGRLVVSFDYPPKVEIIDLQGNVINKIETNKKGSKLFKSPWYACISSDGEFIYISDRTANSVIHMTFDGEIKSEYTYMNLRGPYKLCADQRGNIYVASHDNRTVHNIMISPDCSKSKVLLTKADGLDNDVKSVSHCHETNRLFVGMGGNSRIKVFQLQ